MTTSFGASTLADLLGTAPEAKVLGPSRGRISG
jgi:hypothetical protein